MAAQGMPSDSTNFNAGRGANAQQSLGGLTGMAINLLNGRRLQQVAVRPFHANCCNFSVPPVLAVPSANTHLAKGCQAYDAALFTLFA